jgi:hypothetical protein
MAKTTIILTDAYQSVATGAATFTIKQRGAGKILFNDVNTDDVAAYEYGQGSTEINEQFKENETRTTYARATGAGWVIIVDGVL